MLSVAGMGLFTMHEEISAPGKSVHGALDMGIQFGERLLDRKLRR